MLNKFIWKIFISFLIISFTTLSAVTIYSINTFRHHYLTHRTKDFKNHSEMVSKLLTEYIKNKNYNKIDSLCKYYSKKLDIKITLFNNSGDVYGESSLSIKKIINEKLKDKKNDEIKNYKIIKNKGVKISNYAFFYPIKNNQFKKEWHILMSAPFTFIIELLDPLFGKLIRACIILIVLASITSWIVSSRIVKPIEKIRESAKQIADGKFSNKIYIKGAKEIEDLADTINWMSMQLNEKIKNLVDNKGRQDAILSSMHEGVIAFGVDKKVITINYAASEMLNVSYERAINRSIREILRNTEIHEFVDKLFKSKNKIQKEIYIPSSEYNKGLYLHMTGAALINKEKQKIGCLIVLNDITNIKKLENMRREFVGNVSHELRTPLTVLKGYLETLLEGGLNNKNDARNFVMVAKKNVDRLHLLVEDILNLSKLEKEIEHKEVKLRDSNLYDIINTSIQLCDQKAKEKDIKINLDCSKDIIIKGNAFLMEQAMINLIDNAVKFSNEKEKVDINVYEQNEKIRVEVKDYGIGIDERHLPRLFERFYRVDKARSREIGGTGLGLAIVKHIAISHNGSVDVKSKKGSGSSFNIWLPKV